MCVRGGEHTCRGRCVRGEESIHVGGGVCEGRRAYV